ncbi:DMT family transporter [Aquabacterium sp.]|uniref:DMT family transporter n=1 Tax=Aquabacterium sp. TaxID=1872578 RepID=UPI003D6CF065
MRARDLAEMLLLAALWGASFLFLRMAAPVVGPLAVAAFRVTGAALMLWPLLLWRKQAGLVVRRTPVLLLAGLVTCVLPFLGLSHAARALPAGLLSILNATTPLWGALVGWLWMRERLSAGTVAGLLMGLAGVALLATDRTHIDGELAQGAVAIALASTLMYAIATHHTRRYLNTLPPLSVSTGCLSAAALVLAVPAWLVGPQPSGNFPAPPATWAEVPQATWLALTGLAVLCTAVAYLLFYRLLARVGPTRAMTVTFLIPVFGMLWGWLFLHEEITWPMLASTTVILLGTLLSNGMLSTRLFAKERIA